LRGCDLISLGVRDVCHGESMSLVLIPLNTELIRCGEPRRRWSTVAPKTCAPCNGCLATPSWSQRRYLDIEVDDALEIPEQTEIWFGPRPIGHTVRLQ